jgi:hypothetical protein
MNSGLILSEVFRHLFEEEIQASAALLGEMLWNPRRDEKDILNAALSPYYRIVQ